MEKKRWRQSGDDPYGAVLQCQCCLREACTIEAFNICEEASSLAGMLTEGTITENFGSGTEAAPLNRHRVDGKRLRDAEGYLGSRDVQKGV